MKILTAIYRRITFSTFDLLLLSKFWLIVRHSVRPMADNKSMDKHYSAERNGDQRWGQRTRVRYLAVIQYTLVLSKCAPRESVAELGGLSAMKILTAIYRRISFSTFDVHGQFRMEDL